MPCRITRIGSRPFRRRELPKPAPSHFDGYDITYEYCDLDDRLLFYVRRREATGGKRKQFHPLVYGVLNGEKGWHSKHPIPKPLYGLNRPTMLPDATVLLCEGEKAANAAQMMFPEFACVSWCGGAKAAQYADVSPLAERDVLVWPDNDVEGHSAAADLRKMLPQVRVLRVEDLPPGGDAADIYPENPEAWLRAHLPAEDRRETNLPAFLTAEEWLSGISLRLSLSWANSRGRCANVHRRENGTRQNAAGVCSCCSHGQRLPLPSLEGRSAMPRSLHRR